MAEWDRIEVDGSPMRLYVGMPSLGRAFPAVIVIQHGPGVDRFIEDRVETLSQQGYLAIAPDLYHRQTEDGDMMTRIGRLRDPEVISDVNAAVNYARRLKDTQLGDVGIIGFCMGGRVAYLMAASKPVFKAAGVFYGGLRLTGTKLGAGIPLAGWFAVLMVMMAPRPEGDFVLAAGLTSYLYLFVGAVAGVVCATLPTRTTFGPVAGPDDRRRAVRDPHA